VQAQGSFKSIGSQPLDRVDKTRPYEVTPVVMEGSQPDIGIHQVVFDWESRSVHVNADGVQGEVYILRLNQGETGLVMEEQVYIEDSKDEIEMNMTFRKDLTYTFVLYDYYNHPHSVFTWEQPFDFEAVEVVAEPEPIDVPPEPMAKTDDMFNNPIFYTALLCALAVLAVVQVVRRRGESK
jgi:hypothetical protein